MITVGEVLTRTQLQLWQTACDNVAKHCQDGYAINYAKAGRKMVRLDEVRTQALYILNNIKHWRSDLAREVRVNLKAVSTWDQP